LVVLLPTDGDQIVSAKVGFQSTRKEQSRKREASAQASVPPADYELVRFGSPVKELGADRSSYVEEIARLWAEAQDRFLKIGRYLVRAKERLPHGSYEAMLADELPFGRHVAWQLRTVALAVDRGRLEEERLPQSYATAFKLATLDDDMLEAAKREDVVRPTVTRAEVANFVKRMSEERRGISSPRELLFRERNSLVKQAERLASELQVVRARISAVEREIASVISVDG
jgi:hypothetical protein